MYVPIQVFYIIILLWFCGTIYSFTCFSDYLDKIKGKNLIAFYLIFLFGGPAIMCSTFFFLCLTMILPEDAMDEYFKDEK